MKGFGNIKESKLVKFKDGYIDEESYDFLFQLKKSGKYRWEEIKEKVEIEDGKIVWEGNLDIQGTSVISIKAKGIKGSVFAYGVETLIKIEIEDEIRGNLYIGKTSVKEVKAGSILGSVFADGLKTLKYIEVKDEILGDLYIKGTSVISIKAKGIKGSVFAYGVETLKYIETKEKGKTLILGKNLDIRGTDIDFQLKVIKKINNGELKVKGKISFGLNIEGREGIEKLCNNKNLVIPGDLDIKGTSVISIKAKGIKGSVDIEGLKTLTDIEIEEEIGGFLDIIGTTEKFQEKIKQKINNGTLKVNGDFFYDKNKIEELYEKNGILDKLYNNKLESFDTRKTLNRNEDVLLSKFFTEEKINEITKNGITIEKIEEILKNAKNNKEEILYKYMTQITIHLKVDENYKEIIENSKNKRYFIVNENETLGIKYDIIDKKKKEDLKKRISSINNYLLNNQKQFGADNLSYGYLLKIEKGELIIIKESNHLNNNEKDLAEFNLLKEEYTKIINRFNKSGLKGVNIGTGLYNRPFVGTIYLLKIGLAFIYKTDIDKFIKTLFGFDEEIDLKTLMDNVKEYEKEKEKLEKRELEEKLEKREKDKEQEEQEFIEFYKKIIEEENKLETDFNLKDFFLKEKKYEEYKEYKELILMNEKAVIFIKRDKKNNNIRYKYVFNTEETAGNIGYIKFLNDVSSDLEQKNTIEEKKELLEEKNEIKEKIILSEYNNNNYKKLKKNTIRFIKIVEDDYIFIGGEKFKTK